MDLIKLNVGGGPKRIEGFVNIDALEWNGATDKVHDLTQFPWPIDDRSVEEILCEEFLEHISFKQTFPVFKELYRILIPTGRLKLQVPDCGKMMKMYVEGKICDCVPHKPKTLEEHHADDTCFTCGGKAEINKIRWLLSFVGAQKHPFDTHKAIFTEEILLEALRVVGFMNNKVIEHPFKLIVETVK